MHAQWLNVAIEKAYDEFSNALQSPEVVQELLQRIESTVGSTSKHSPITVEYSWSQDGKHCQAALSIYYDQAGQIRTICRVTGFAICV